MKNIFKVSKTTLSILIVSLFLFYWISISFVIEGSYYVLLNHLPEKVRSDIINVQFDLERKGILPIDKDRFIKRILYKYKLEELANIVTIGKAVKIPECNLLVKFSPFIHVDYFRYNGAFELYRHPFEVLGNEVISIRCSREPLFAEKTEQVKEKPLFLNWTDIENVDLQFNRSTGNGSPYGVTDTYYFKKNSIYYIIGESYWDQDIATIFKRPRTNSLYGLHLQFTKPKKSIVLKHD